MNIQNFRIFLKSGSNLQMTPNPYINLVFGSATGVGAKGFLITNSSEYAVSAEIQDGGYLYDGIITLSYAYLFDNGATVQLSSAEASINTVDVSIFDPIGRNTKSISSLTLDLSTAFVYPSVTYAGAIFLDPVSVQLIETEHLFIFEEYLGSYIRPYDNDNFGLIFKFIGEENQIQFFTIDEDQHIVDWTDEIVFNTDVFVKDVPITLNIGFRADKEGVYERMLRIYHVVGNDLRTLGEIIVNAQAIGEDERFRDLLTNFGLPDPKDFPTLFKEANINEVMPDWKILNPKSKHMILEHDKIMPYIGTYKALIHALKWLGYDDIYVREWFKNVKENKKISFIVPFEAKDRTQTILMFSPEERKVFKKLNQLSLHYCITRETGEIDDWGNPLTENCYAYNLQEIFIKLLALKQWLERNIIGVNCRISDITGEGIYFERFINLLYSTDNIGYNLNARQTLTPITLAKNSELINGDASIALSLKEIVSAQIGDLQHRFIDMIDHVYDASTHLTYHIGDASLLSVIDTSQYLINIGPPIAYPLKDLRDIQWKLSVEKNEAGVIGVEQVTNPLFIYENEIKFYNIFDTSSIFYNVSTNLSLLLEKAYFRDPNNDIWEDSIDYSLYPNPSENGYTLESSLGSIILFDNYMNMNPEIGAVLQYAYDDNYKVPLLSVNNKFSYIDASDRFLAFPKTYYLDILDGKIIMNAGGNNQYFINFNYDTSLNEQKITLNVIYQSERIPLFIVDSSYYFLADTIGHTGGGDPSVLSFDNGIYHMVVNHIGDYNVEVFGWDGYNIPFYNVTRKPYNVWIKHPTIYSLIDNCCNVVCVSTYMTVDEVSTLISQNKYPIYDKHIPLQGLTLEIDTDGKPYIKVPSITYFQDIPEHGSLNRFYNLTERVLNITFPTITIDPDYQSFHKNDDIKLVKFDKGKYELIEEASSHIIDVVGNELWLDQLPGTIAIDSSTDVYIINDTYRTAINASNNETIGHSTIDISGYSFKKNQLVGLIVTDKILSPSYSWGSAYRILSVDGSIHTFNGLLPQQFVDNTSRYKIEAKHAFSTYSNLTIPTFDAIEINNNFNVYLNESYCQEYYLDNTFVFVNILFDHEKVNAQWYDVSDNLVNDTFYYHNNPINIDVSTLVILKATYDPSTYLLNQKNIWTIRYNNTKYIMMKIYNNIVTYIFNERGTYDIEVESYDAFGNIARKTYEGLINVI